MGFWGYMSEFTINEYNTMIGKLFGRFPSFQKIGSGAYKPGIDSMMAMDSLLGHPHTKYATIHIAGTNGKGSVSNMIASVCAAAGLKTGLYTSPHILDFRERMRILDGRGAAGRDGGLRLISPEAVWDFVQKWNEDMDRLDLSFFEITTAMAFDWFAKEEVDVAVIETGLGGRLDSTNIIRPLVSVITNIGFDHCDMLGHTLAMIAGEKAGIIKAGVPALVGEVAVETEPVFAARAAQVGAELTFAEKVEPRLWDRREEIIRGMDLRGDYQRKNLRTVLAAIEVVQAVVPASLEVVPASLEVVPADCQPSGTVPMALAALGDEEIIQAIRHTARRLDFHGRWEKLCDTPYIIADIGHNSHGLRSNFTQLEKMMASGKYARLSIIYATMTDKDVDRIMPLMPKGVEYYFITASNKRAMPAREILQHYLAAGGERASAHCCSLSDAIRSVFGPQRAVRSSASDAARDVASDRHLVYIGGSAYLVSEALPLVEAAREGRSWGSHRTLTKLEYHDNEKVH